MNKNDLHKFQFVVWVVLKTNNRISLSLFFYTYQKSSLGRFQIQYIIIDFHFLKHHFVHVLNDCFVNTIMQRFLIVRKILVAHYGYKIQIF